MQTFCRAFCKVTFFCAVFCLVTACGFAQTTAYTGTYVSFTINQPAAPPSALTCNCQFTPDTTLPTQLPPGLAATNGTTSITISGVPTKAVPLGPLGFFVRDKNNHYAEWTIQFQVIQSPPFMLHPAPAPAPALPVAFAGEPYNVQLMMNDPAGASCPINSNAAAIQLAGLGLPTDLSSGTLSAAKFGGNVPAGAIPSPVIISGLSCATVPAAAYPALVISTAMPATAVTETAGGAVAVRAKPAFNLHYDGLCDYRFSDCDWRYSLVGGVEQSDLSSQNSQTLGFVDLFIRAPWNTRLAYAWLQARFLGAPNTSNTQNIITVATDPTATLTSSTLSQVGLAVDYIVGGEHDFFQPKRAKADGTFGIDNPSSGLFTIGTIAFFGATTPLSSQSATIAYAVPAFGTNECQQLFKRFGPGSRNGYDPVLPVVASGPGLVTTTTTVTGQAPTTTQSGPYCVIQPGSITTSSTTSGVTTTVTSDGTAISTIAFAPEDRSSFLLKYGAGFRLITRTPSSPNGCSPATPCSRAIVDLTFGQDQAITGGIFHNAVFKSDVIFPIVNSGVYFFGSSSIRISANTIQNPLILTPVPLAAAGSTTPGAITVPSSSVFVLPLKQSNRDFYRIGLGLDLSKMLPKLFGASGK